MGSSEQDELFYDADGGEYGRSRGEYNWRDHDGKALDPEKEKNWWRGIDD